MASLREAAWPRHEFTVDEVERMVTTGVLDPDLHVELLDGDLVEVSPQGPEHAARHTALRDRLIAAYAGVAHVRDQCPLVTGRISLPEPDLAVIRGSALEYVTRHPSGRDALLVVELAITSQRIDRAKARTYAAGGVSVYWILDGSTRVLEEHGGPTPTGYVHHRVLAANDVVELPELGQTWRVDELFGGSITTS